MLNLNNIITHKFEPSFNYQDADIQSYIKDDTEKFYNITADYNPTENVSRLVWIIKHKNKSDKPIAIHFLYYLRYDLLLNPIILDYYNHGYYNKHYLIIKLLVGNKFILHSLWKDYQNNWYNNMTNNYFINGEGKLTEIQTELINKLLRGYIVKLDESHQLVDSKNNDQFALIVTPEIINATEIIQNYWRKCRYHPSYKMCQKVQINNLKEENIFLIN